VVAVGGGAAHVVDRARGGLDEPAELGRRGRFERRARVPVGPAEPMHAFTARSSGHRWTDSEHTAITIALRVPIFANCCGPSAGAISKATMSSSSSSALRFGPVTNSATGTRRAPRSADATSTTASEANSGGSPSPAGDAVPRLPPTVPRLRICGEPTVRLAIARPGSCSPSSAISRVYETPAPMRSVPFVRPCSRSSGTRARSMISSGRVRSKLSSTMRSVPPAMGRAPGCAALISRASRSVSGRRISMTAPQSRSGSAPAIAPGRS
jgi:hypothetical protein